MCANCIAGEDPFNPLWYRGGYGQCQPCGDNTFARIAFIGTCIALVVTIALLCIHWRKTLKAIEHVAKRASAYRDTIRQSFYEKVFKVDADILKSMKSNVDATDAEVVKRDKNAMLSREPDNEITLWSQTHGLGVKFKILISLYQVTMAFVDFFNVEWPATFSLMMLNLTSIINFQFFNISFVGCLSQENYITTFASATLVPIFLMILIFAAQKLWVLGGKSEKDFSLDDVERYIFYVLFLVYPKTSRVILSMFNCYQFADGSEVVVDSFTLSCNAAYKSTIWPIAAVFTFVYPLGVPIVLLYKLYVHKDVLYDRVTGEASGVAAKKFGGMYSMYEPQYYYWEVVELYRKLFLCGVLQFVQPGSGTQIVICIAFTTIYASIFSYCSPLKERSDVLLEVCSELEIFSVAFAALLLKLNLTKEEKHDEAAFDAVLVALMLLPLLMFLGALLLAFSSSLMGSQYLGYAFTQRLYPGILQSFPTYLRDGRTMTKMKYEQNDKRRRRMAPRLARSLKNMRRTINQNTAAEKYGKVSLVIVERASLLENIWYEMYREGRIQKSDLRVWRDWLARLCEAYHKVMRNFHDQHKALSYVARLREIIKEERESLFVSSRHEAVQYGQEPPSTDADEFSNSALDSINRVLKRTLRIRKHKSAKGGAEIKRLPSPRAKYFEDLEEGDAEEKDALSMSEEEDTKQGEVLGQAVRSTRKKSRRMIKEYGEGEASTSSIDLDEVVEEGYSDDDDYDDDDEDMFDEPFESKSSKIDRHPSHVLDLDDFEDDDEDVSDVKESAEDSAEFDLDNVVDKEDGEHDDVDTNEESNAEEREFGLDDVDTKDEEEDEVHSNENETYEDEFELDDIETKDEDGTVDRSDISEIDNDDDSFALDGSDVESVMTDRSGSDHDDSDGEFDLNDIGDDNDDDDDDTGHHDESGEFDLDDAPPPPSSPPRAPKMRKHRPSPIRIPKRNRTESAADLDTFKSVLTGDSDDEDVFVDEDGGESSDHSDLEI